VEEVAEALVEDLHQEVEAQVVLAQAEQLVLQIQVVAVGAATE
jgi:hypothetical protein